MKQPQLGTKGLDLEEALRAYFLDAGYFVVRGVPYRLDGEDVTDVDLWLYERPTASTRRRLLVDIKNKKSPKAVERIIWAKGLEAALGLDGTIVATTDRRTATRKLAKSLEVTLLDGEAVATVIANEELKSLTNLSEEDLSRRIKTIDQSRRSVEWRDNYLEARASLISGMGAQSANTNLNCQAFFANEVLSAHPGSAQAEAATRLVYLTSGFAAISLDFMLADHAFRSTDDRRTAIINGIRYGQADTSPSLPVISAAIGLARKYAENGNAVAKRIEQGFLADAAQIQAEIVADGLLRLATPGKLFELARSLTAAALCQDLKSFDEMTVDERLILGTFLDFNDISRETFASAWTAAGQGGRATHADIPSNSISASLHNDPSTVTMADSSDLRPNTQNRDESKNG